MAALDTVADYVTQARVFLQDQVPPYRYPDVDVVQALSMAMLEARKLRMDLFIGQSTIQSFTVNDTTPVLVDPMYRVAFVYYIIGSLQLRDDENDQDQRAQAFMNMWTAKLLSLQS